MPEAVIVSVARSPIGRARKGSLIGTRPDELAAQIVSSALDAVPQLDRATVDELYMGCGIPAGEQGGNIGRVVATLLGLDTVPAASVNRYCTSSMLTTQMAFHAIRAGEGDVFVSAGVESVSRARNADPVGDERDPRLPEHPVGDEPWVDPRSRGELPDLFMGMGLTAEIVARRYGVSRREQDEYALASQLRTKESIASGFWATDITPVVRGDGTVLAADDGPRPGTTIEGLSGLSPVFLEDGTVTAGNSCPINDGAAALVVMSDTRARELGITPLARVVSSAVTALSPEIMGVAPIEASRLALRRAGLTVGDLDLVEINEAFAAQVVPIVREVGFDPERVNVHGGAIAIGHPFGMSGARITSTLVHGLQWGDGRFGLQTMCTAGGQGMAMILERVT